VQNSIEE